jgi:hypothetical protein
MKCPPVAHTAIIRRGGGIRQAIWEGVTKIPDPIQDPIATIINPNNVISLASFVMEIKYVVTGFSICKYLAFFPS